MPSNGKFGFCILVGDKELPEYTHPEDNTRVLVESILWAPVTYWLEIKEFCKFSGEVEAQKWPVTPYEIKVCDQIACMWARIQEKTAPTKTLTPSASPRVRSIY